MEGVCETNRRALVPRGDVLQFVRLPPGGFITIRAAGKGGGVERAMEECKIDNRANDSEFDELVEAMQSDKYWVRFFVRPCCPAPDLEGAAEMLDHLIRDVEAREDFTPEQKAALSSVIGARKQWYATSGLCRGSRA